MGFPITVRTGTHAQTHTHTVNDAHCLVAHCLAWAVVADCCTRAADTVLKVDTTTDTVTTIGDPGDINAGRHRVPQDGKYKYLGGALARDDNLYCFPCDAERVLMINTHDDGVKTIGPEFLHDEIGLCVNKWQNGFRCRDGAVYAIPQRARGVLRVLPAADGSGNHEVTVLDCGAEFDTYSDGKDKFEGGVMGEDGCVYCIPLRAKRVLKLIPGPSVHLQK
jgi:hypothetical protein